MIENVSKTEQIIKRLKKKKILTLNRPEDIKAIEEMNIEMEKVRREYTVKNAKSERSASELVCR